jgi:ankyrin
MFHVSCERGISNRIAPLHASGIDPCCKQRAQSRSLRLAALKGHYIVIRELLDHGVHMNTVCSSDSNRNALHEAVDGRHLNVVRTLVERGIEPDAFKWTGRPALHIAIDGRNGPIAIALIEAGAAVDARSRTRHTTLQIVAIFGNAGIVGSLLEHGADVNAKSPDNKSAIQMAVAGRQHPKRKRDYCEIISILIISGADLVSETEEQAEVLHA